METKRKLHNIMVTGGAGFIGSNFVRYLLKEKDFKGVVVNADKLTYAGNLANLSDISKTYGGKRYFFERVDICDKKTLSKIFKNYDIDTVVNFAAESHVDRSIISPEGFVVTNVIGTLTLLEVAREFWKQRQDVLFHHISTDEVYGSLGPSGTFNEDSPYLPRSPYSASKAASDHFVHAFYHTYELSATLSNCSNNYGPYQFPEKLIPLMITNMLERKALPVYGDGSNVRDWLFVEDHNSAVWSIMKQGRLGETYNIGGENEWKNLELVLLLCETMAMALGKNRDYFKDLIAFVEDRPGHDFRYAIDCSKIKSHLGWNHKYSFQEGLRRTVDWYIDNKEWVDQIRSGEYIDWIENNYGKRSQKQTVSSL